MNKILTFYRCEPGAGRRTIALELARHWGEGGQAVMVLAIDPQTKTEAAGSLSADLENWVPRFRSLAPVMLRNYLSASGESYAKVVLTKFPGATLMTDLLTILRKAFEWTVVLAPENSLADSVALLDQSDLLLW